MKESPPTKLKRRHVLALLASASALGLSRLGCFRLARPAEASGPLSDRAQALLDAAWKGLDPARVLDTHVHIVGTGAGGTGCYVNSRMLATVSHPIDALKFDIYRRAAGVEHEDQCDQEYADHLLKLVREQKPHGRALIFAFDQTHDEAGKPQPELTEFYTPNDYVLKLARENPDAFVACASVHPYRADAVEALRAAVEGGAVAVKWLPNAMRVDPASAKCDAFYEAMAKLGVPLISHAGEEKAVQADDAQRLGNPLHLRRALDHGVKVVIAHCASLGQNPDLDSPAAEKPWVDNFELFTRLMAEKKYEGLLFGDVSAMAQVNRVGKPLQEVLSRDDLQARVVNGSDYPLPAVNVLMQTSAIEKAGFLDAAEREALNEIDQHNPLLFDFAIKRTVKWNGRKLRDDVFMVRPEIFRV